MTKLRSIVASSVSHDTIGQISSFAATSLTYAGSLGNNKWIALVDQTLNNNYPCNSGTVTADSLDSTHSGSLRGTTDPHGSGSEKVVTFNTLGLSTSVVFAVCYTEADGTLSATWIDTAIRLTVSKLSTLQYSTPARVIEGTLATNRIPQMTNIPLEYTGLIAAGKWLSFVDQSQNSFYPCSSTTVTTTPTDTRNSGVLHDSGNAKSVIVPQGKYSHNMEFLKVYFDAAVSFAVCYAETSGLVTDSTWADSGIRIKPSKISSIKSMSSEHTTAGGLTRLTDLSMEYVGTLEVHKWISLVDQTLHFNNPCANGPTAAATADSAHSGASQAGQLDNTLTLDTTIMSTVLTLALCYSEALGSTSAVWEDSGLRLTLSKVAQISYGTYSTSKPVRTFRPLNTTTPNPSADYVPALTLTLTQP